MDACVAAWLAGLIDGEGTVCVARIVRGNSPAPRFRPIVNITNTNRDLLETITKRTGLGVIYHMGHDPRLVNKTCWNWKARNDEMRILLPQVRPWLVVKARQADLVVELLQLKLDNTPRRGYKMVDVLACSARQDEIYQETTVLNRRGRPAGTEEGERDAR